MKLIIHHSQGNANVRASAIGFAEANMLAEFHTSIACFPGSFLDSIANISFLADIRRRRLNPLLKRFTHTSPVIELGRLLSLKVGFHQLTQQEKGRFCIEAVTHSLDKKVAARLKKAMNHDVKAVYAYEDGALFSFREAKRLGLQCLYDLPTGYWRAKLRILEEEKKKFPAWQNTIRGLLDSEKKLAAKEDEVKMADRIFVASTFTASTLKDFPGKLPPVEVVPYGFPDVGPKRDYSQNTVNSPIKLLFVGSLSQQKGIANLFEAVNAIGSSVSLTLVGRKVNEDCEVLNTELSKHRWVPSLPHHEILEMMRIHDVLVFPTLFDGFGLVISEAMSQGTPVITTYNSGGPDLIEHGKNGWLVEAGSTFALQQAIEALVANPSSIAKTGREAMETARMRPWNLFRQQLSGAVKNHCLSLK
ncbi:MAG: glycosyl transferase family 1 [Ferruginibacter sp.]|nr:glycosyl transferase family 1 [Ferruginibacter sp.]